MGAFLSYALMTPSLPPPPSPSSMKDDYSSFTGLPPEVLFSLLDRLGIPDRVRFGSVCSSFLSGCRSHRSLSSSTSTQNPPWMLLPEESTDTAAAFYSITDGRIYKIPQPGPPVADRRWLGTSEGWLVALDQATGLVSLLNPLTTTQISLPPLVNSSPEQLQLEFSKALLSWNPPPAAASCASMGRYTVVLLLGWHSRSPSWPSPLVCIRHGDTAWTSFGDRDSYADAAFHKGHLYTMQSNGTVEAWDVTTAPAPTPLMTVIMPQWFRCTSFGPKYLVDSADGLLQVWRSREFSETEFRVFRLDLSSKDKEWVEVESLGDMLLFLTSYSSLSCPSSSWEHPEFRANCIFFDRATAENNRESLVFMWETKNAGRVLLHGAYKKPSPIWIVPSLLSLDAVPCYQ